MLLDSWQQLGFFFILLIVTCCVLLGLYKAIRPYFPVSVECWFCLYKLQVPYSECNSWECPNCDQYNGFNQDGDYNKVISAQRSLDLNPSPKTAGSSRDSFNSGSDILCATCERNQVLKTRNLAHFVPYSEANFEQEIEAYRSQLEEVYKLCYGCELRVQRHLAEQDSLLAKKLERFMRRSPTRAGQDVVPPSDCQEHIICSHTTPWHIRCLHITSLLASFVLVCGSVSHFIQHSQLHIDLSVYITSYVWSYLQNLYSNAMSTVLLGIAAKTAATLGLILCRNQRVTWSDAMSLVTWFGSLIAFSSKTEKIPAADLYFLQTWIAFLTALIQLYVTLIYRNPPRPKPQFVKKSLPRRRPGSPSERGSPSSDISYTVTSVVTGSQPSHEPPLDQLGGLSIDGQVYQQQHHKVSSSQYSIPQELRQRSNNDRGQARPLLSAPRFNPSVNHQLQQPTQVNSYSTTVTPVIPDSVSDSEESSELADDSDSETTPLPHCHVDNSISSKRSVRSLLRRITLGVILGVLVSVVIFTVTDLASLMS